MTERIARAGSVDGGVGWGKEEGCDREEVRVLLLIFV